jgi:hypothetical protein
MALDSCLDVRAIDSVAAASWQENSSDCPDDAFTFKTLRLISLATLARQ